MSKHTAGEWKARKQLHNWSVVSPTKFIASIGPHTANNDSVEAEANAHLMAAASVMYDLLVWLDRKGGLGLDVHERIRVVIEKAEVK